MIPNVGGTELIILLVIVLLLFGAKRIPELAKGLGSGVREFRKGVRGEVDEEEEKNDGELTPGKDDTRVKEEPNRAERVSSTPTEPVQQAEPSEQKR
jgi:sec-independent protein translocase protein TatA